MAQREGTGTMAKETSAWLKAEQAKPDRYVRPETGVVRFTLTLPELSRIHQALDALPAATTPLNGGTCCCSGADTSRCPIHQTLPIPGVNAPHFVTGLSIAPAVPAPAPETDDERWARLSAKQPAVPVAQPDQFGESNDLNGLIQPTRSPEELAAEIIDAIPAMPDPWGEPDGEPHKTVVALIRAYLKGD